MEMTRCERLFILLLVAVTRAPKSVSEVRDAAGAAEVAAGCRAGETVTFEKWSGVRAARGEPVFVAAGAAAGACTERCRRAPRCAAVAVSHARADCTGYAPAPARALLQDNDYNFFTKVCMKLPAGCEARWWAVEAAAGYSLLASGGRRLHNLTSQDCSRALIQPENLQYRSAQWVAASGGVDAELRDASDDVGACALYAEDKFTEPESYRVANYRTLYKENQCRHDFPAKIERCSYEEYYNQTLKHVEVALGEISKDECKTSCEREVRFVCRGFSWRDLEPEREETKGQCSLHSEDMLTLGSWLLRKAPGTSYYRRVICLNISVECSEEQMVVTYRPRGAFRGRLLVPGRGEGCGAGASGGQVRLVLPLRGSCDVNFAYAVSNGALGRQNKTMAYAMVMIQNNPIIQTAGDRWVRVGCAPGAVRASHTLDAALTVSVDTVKASTAEGGGGGGGAVPASAVFNTSGAAPAPLTMYVVRGAGGGGGGSGAEPHGAVSLGEILELRVETTDESEIEAYHLVASSRLGDSSVLLLDNRGCPTGQVDFPGFTRSWAGGEGGGGGSVQRLSARFKAFRFPHSHVVRFALMVRFCERRCAQVECGPRSAKRSRSSRQSDDELSTNELQSESADVREDITGWDQRVPDADSTGEGADTSSKLVVAQSGAGVAGCRGAVAPDRVPLELELLVGSRDLLTADTLVRADHQPRDDGVATVMAARVPTAGGAGGLVCMHELLVVALVMAWLVVQLLLLVGCCVVVKRYRKFAELASQKEYQSFDNVGFDTLSTSTHRRVHWPDQNVDILHAN